MICAPSVTVLRTAQSNARLGAAAEVLAHHRRPVLVDGPEQRTQREVLAERLDLPLVVRVHRTLVRVPQDLLVVELAVPLDDSADRDGGADGLGRPADHEARVGVGERVDVRGVLRPQHQVGLGDLARPDLGGQSLGLLHVVVEDGTPLGVEVESRARDVALDERDGRGTVLGLVTDQRPRGQRTHDGDADGEQRHRCRAPAQDAGTARLDGQPDDLVEPEAAEHDREAEHRSATERGERQEDTVGLSERDLPPGEAAEGRTRACRFSGDPDRRRPHRPPGQPGDDRDARADERDADRLHRYEREPGPRTDLDAGPHQQGQQESEAEQIAEAETGLPGATAQGPAEDREGGQSQPPQGPWRETDVQQHSGERRDGGRNKATHQG
jgi:hypothetical protein